MIASINDSDVDDVGTSQTRRNRRNKSSVKPMAATADMLQTINNTAAQTAASLLINDLTPNKTQSLNILSTQSVGARSLLNPLQTNESTIKLNRIDTVNVLDFLGNLYDNSIQVIITE
ncbi:p12 [Palpita vitrealis nucleopolyhedrovirus]|uniref:P12 n=1 Tax=Palpita vitrealis nucleopolyhedrovirus TaxID=2951960 RepID=A0AAE9LNJ8_9ABAC|nr:p12 [Palpita vitrealis nucleopolyhedrovirus]